MGYLVIDAAVIAVCTTFLVLEFRWLAKDSRRIADEHRARGLDPDDVYLRIIAKRQAAQKHRFRNPVAWYGMWYLKWERGRIKRR